MTKTTIYVTRHGQTQWNIEERMQGHRDSPLTEQGMLQARWLRDSLAPVDFAAIYASPSSRTRMTAEILRHLRELDVTCHDDLREISMGDWEGQKRQEIEQAYAAAYTAFWETPHLYSPENGGESYYDVQKRVLPLLDTLLARHEDETILLVTHAATLKIIMSHFAKIPLAQLWNPPFVHPTALCKVVIEDQRASIELYGDISHYQERMDGSNW